MQNRDTEENIKTTMKEIAHQWRQPLCEINAIVCTIQTLLEDNGFENETVDKNLLNIEKLTSYMSETINDFNRVNKPSDKQSSLEKIMQDFFSVVDVNAEQHSVKISIEIAKDLENVLISRELLQVLVIIVNNSIDAHVERNIFDAWIKISAQKLDDKILIEISDNGGGISKSVMEKIFNSDYTTKHSSEGTGLGLSLAKKIIHENLAGELDVENCNKGTCFRILMPSL